jgi:hypothetical protein
MLPQLIVFLRFIAFHRQLTLSLQFALGRSQMIKIENDTSNNHLDSNPGNGGNNNMTCFADPLGEGEKSLYRRSFAGYSSVAHFR